MAKRASELQEITERVQLRALKAAEKALMEAGEEGYDGSGDVPWNQRPTRVAAGLMLAQKAMDRVAATESDQRQFGLLLMRGRFKSVDEWEKHAAEVDAAPPASQLTTTLDAEVVAALPPKDK